MSTALEVRQGETALPLELTVSKLGFGGVEGLSPTVAVRDASTLDSYLDFADSVFKTAGWTTKYASMSEVERGHYHRILNVFTLGFAVGFRFSAEYHVDAGFGFAGEDLDLFIVKDDVTLDLSLVRKYHTNRMQEVSGNPGTLTLYDDDDVTPLRVHQLRDELGGAIAPTTLTPARRSKGT